jgi:hypothetical protein
VSIFDDPRIDPAKVEWFRTEFGPGASVSSMALYRDDVLAEWAETARKRQRRERLTLLGPRNRIRSAWGALRGREDY